MLIPTIVVFLVLAGLPVTLLIMASNRKKTPPREQQPIRSYAPRPEKAEARK